MRNSREPDSKANDKSDPHSRKHSSSSIRTSAGIQIDCNDEQCENEDEQIRTSVEPDSNCTQESDRLLQKEQGPKYRIIEMPSKSTRKVSETAKCEFPSSTAISEMCDAEKLELSTATSEAGRQIDFNDEQPDRDSLSI
jgi:hypothetical protein